MIGKALSTRLYSPPTPTTYLTSTPRFELKGIPSDVFFFVPAWQPVLCFVFTAGAN